MKRSGESGFAMLLVFLMASVIAISLYIQMPRVAFEAQRQKEQLLVERGEQYKRAIQLFVRANGRYPSRIEDLESFNNRRFLRHKFKDPITGKSEWRLIHVNAAGVFSDSITNKPKKDDKDQSISTTGSIAQIPDLGAVAVQGQQTAGSAANRRRASEGGAAPAVLGPDGQPIQPQNPGFPGAPGNQLYPGQTTQQQPYQPYQPPTAPPDQSNPGAQPGYALVTPNPQMGNNFGQPTGAPVPAEMNPAGGQALPPGQGFRPTIPIPPPNTNFANPATSGGSSIGSGSSIGGASSIGGSSSSIGGLQSSLGGDSSIGSNSSFGGGAQNRVFPQPVPPPQSFPQPMPSFPQAGGGQPNQSDPGLASTPVNGQIAGGGFQPPIAQPGNPATQMIQNMLTTPRQAPPDAAQFGAQPGGQPVGGQQAGGQQIGAGIAGVASTSENAAIMIYNQRSNYNEWEFIFDINKQKAAPNANAGVNGTPVQNMGSSPQGNTATPTSPFGNSSPFGNTSPFGNNSGIGNNSNPGQSPNPQGQMGQQPPPTDLRLGQQ